MGWTYNTVPNADTNAPIIAAVGITFCTLSLITVCLRMYVRGILIKAIGPDDWLIVITWFLCFGFMVVTIFQTKWGLGLQHLSDMPEANIYNFGLLQYIGAPFYILSILGFKLSLLASFLRIMVDRIHRAVIVVLIVANCCFTLAFLLVQINLCTPIAKQWNPAITTGSCVTAVPFYTSVASITIVFDVLIMITPYPMLIKTQIQRKKKLILLGIFSLGTFVTAIQLIRILTIKALANYIDSSNLIMWSMVENNLGTIITCIPTLSPMVKSWREHSSSSGSRTGGPKSRRRMSQALHSLQKGTDGSANLTLGSNYGRSISPENSTTVMAGNMGNNGSEEFILHNLDDRNIHKVTEVTVSREVDSKRYSGSL